MWAAMVTPLWNGQLVAPIHERFRGLTVAVVFSSFSSTTHAHIIQQGETIVYVSAVASFDVLMLMLLGARGVW